MSSKNYKNILARVQSDTGLDRDVLDVICKAFLYEMAEEMIDKTIDLPYIGDLSLRNKKLEPNKFLKDLKKQGGSYAIKFRRKYETHSDGDSE